MFLLMGRDAKGLVIIIGEKVALLRKKGLLFLLFSR